MTDSDDNSSNNLNKDDQSADVKRASSTSENITLDGGNLNIACSNSLLKKTKRYGKVYNSGEVTLKEDSQDRRGSHASLSNSLGMSRLSQLTTSHYSERWSSSDVSQRGETYSGDFEDVFSSNDVPYDKFSKITKEECRNSFSSSIPDEGRYSMASFASFDLDKTNDAETVLSQNKSIKLETPGSDSSDESDYTEEPSGSRISAATLYERAVTQVLEEENKDTKMSIGIDINDDSTKKTDKCYLEKDALKDSMNNIKKQESVAETSYYMENAGRNLILSIDNSPKNIKLNSTVHDQDNLTSLNNLSESRGDVIKFEESENKRLLCDSNLKELTSIKPNDQLLLDNGILFRMSCTSSEGGYDIIEPESNLDEQLSQHGSVDSSEMDDDSASFSSETSADRSMDSEMTTNYSPIRVKLERHVSIDSSVSTLSEAETVIHMPDNVASKKILDSRSSQNDKGLNIVKSLKGLNVSSTSEPTLDKKENIINISSKRKLNNNLESLSNSDSNIMVESKNKFDSIKSDKYEKPDGTFIQVSPQHVIDVKKKSKIDNIGQNDVKNSSSKRVTVSKSMLPSELLEEQEVSMHISDSSTGDLKNLESVKTIILPSKNSMHVASTNVIVHEIPKTKTQNDTKQKHYDYEGNRQVDSRNLIFDSQNIISFKHKQNLKEVGSKVKDFNSRSDSSSNSYDEQESSSCDDQLVTTESFDSEEISTSMEVLHSSTELLEQIKGSGIKSSKTLSSKEDANRPSMRHSISSFCTDASDCDLIFSETEGEEISYDDTTDDDLNLEEEVLKNFVEVRSLPFGQ